MVQNVFKVQGVSPVQTVLLVPLFAPFDCDCGLFAPFDVIVEWLCTNSCGVLELHKWRWRRHKSDGGLVRRPGPAQLHLSLILRGQQLKLTPAKLQVDIGKVTTPVQ